MRKTKTAYTGAKDRCLSCMSLVQPDEQVNEVPTRNGDRVVHVNWQDCAKGLRTADLEFTRALGPAYRHGRSDPHARFN